MSAKKEKGERPSPSDDGLTQSERFIKAAQELGTDDDPERFAERVRKLTKQPKHDALSTHALHGKKNK